MSSRNLGKALSNFCHVKSHTRPPPKLGWINTPCAAITSNTFFSDSGTASSYSLENLLQKAIIPQYLVGQTGLNAPKYRESRSRRKSHVHRQVLLLPPIVLGNVKRFCIVILVLLLAFHPCLFCQWQMFLAAVTHWSDVARSCRKWLLANMLCREIGEGEDLEGGVNVGEGRELLHGLPDMDSWIVELRILE